MVDNNSPIDITSLLFFKLLEILTNLLIEDLSSSKLLAKLKFMSTSTLVLAVAWFSP